MIAMSFCLSDHLSVLSITNTSPTDGRQWPDCMAQLLQQPNSEREWPQHCWASGSQASTWHADGGGAYHIGHLGALTCCIYCVEYIHSVGTINNLKTSYSTQLKYVTEWRHFDVRWTSWSHLDCLQLDGARNLDITWSHVLHSCCGALLYSREWM